MSIASSLPGEGIKKRVPLYLVFGYLAIAIFMTGDGFEQAFLSHYIVSLGFTKSDASFVFAAYGFCAGLAAWSAGILAEMFGPKRIMLCGAIIWLAFHSLFITFGLDQKNYTLILLFYCFRAFGYPLFIYSFVVWISREVAPHKMALAMGWFWTMFMCGIGFMGSYVPSITIPLMGEVNTLWLALCVVAVGAIMGYLALMTRPSTTQGSKGNAGEKLKQLSRGISLAIENKSILVSGIIYMICPTAIFGFAVILPFHFMDTLGYSSTEWLRVWSVMLFVNMIMNVFSGALANKVGWMRLVRWMAGVGVACSTLLFYYLPLHAGHSLYIAFAVAAFHGFCLTGFIPVSASFPLLAPEEKGAAISLHNLSVGLGSCIGPAIAGILLPLTGMASVVWVYAGLYIIAGLLTFLVKLPKGY